jgi:hypothetical protein
MTDPFEQLIRDWAEISGVELWEPLRSHLRSLLQSRLRSLPQPEPTWTQAWFAVTTAEAALEFADWATWSLALWPVTVRGCHPSLRRSLAQAGYDRGRRVTASAELILANWQFWESTVRGICGVAHGSIQLVRT